jgi:ankyrin repeat protein
VIDDGTIQLGSSIQGRVLTILVEAGADTEVQDDRGKTALCVAVEHGYAGAATALLRLHANIEAPGEGSPLATASAFGYTVMQRILINAHADLEGGHVRVRPLVAALHNMQSEAARVLIEAGANLTLTDFDRLMAPAYAGGAADVVQALHAANADNNTGDDGPE